MNHFITVRVLPASPSHQKYCQLPHQPLLSCLQAPSPVLQRAPSRKEVETSPFQYKYTNLPWHRFFCCSVPVLWQQHGPSVPVNRESSCTRLCDLKGARYLLLLEEFDGLLSLAEVVQGLPCIFLRILLNAAMSIVEDENDLHTNHLVIPPLHEIFSVATLLSALFKDLFHLYRI